jgi:hypothetical protein
LASYIINDRNSFESRRDLIRDAMVHLQIRDKKWAIFNCKREEFIIKFICRRIFHGDYIILPEEGDKN